MRKDAARTHGLVTEPIPRLKLLEFLKHARRLEERSFGAAVDAEGPAKRAGMGV